MANLLETYKQRLAISESVYSAKHNGDKMSDHKKLITAKLLSNVSNFMNEAFDNSVGVQRSDLGMYKKFALNLVTVALPTLIAPDLVLTYPMSSMSGYVTYLQYTAGSNKGGVERGDVFNDPFHITKPTAERTNYTASKVEFAKATLATGADSFVLNWTPVLKGSVEITIGGTTYVDDGNGGFNSIPEGATKVTLTDSIGNISSKWVMADGSDATLTPATGITIIYGTTRDGNYAPATGENLPESVKGAITFTEDTKPEGEFAISYVYNNVYIPQNDIPLVNAEMKAIPLIARARRIAVYYSQIAAFQAKTDYGFDLGKNLAERAAGELAYEIDTEVVNMLADAARGNSGNAFTWNRAIPVGISLAEHYEGFANTIAQASQVIYDRTQKFAPNYMVIASDVLPVVQFIRGWSAAPTTNIHGPYFAGTLNGVKVYVTSSLQPGEWFLGVNGSDMMTTAAVYAPYMPIVPTQLLQFADGGTSQGFSTLYDLKMLNSNLLVYGKVVGGINTYAPVPTEAVTDGPAYAQNIAVYQPWGK